MYNIINTYYFKKYISYYYASAGIILLDLLKIYRQNELIYRIKTSKTY